MNRQPSPPRSLKKEIHDVSLIKWVGIIMAAIFFVVFPFQTGIFNSNDYSFEKTITDSMLYAFIFFIIMSLHLFKVWRLANWQGILSLAVWLLPSSYVISSFHAASVNNANLMIVISLALAGMFVFGIYFNDTLYSRKAVEFIIISSAYILVIFGLLNLFGQLYYPDSLWFTLGNYRMTAVFQYPNTYAALLIAIFLAALYYITHVSRWQWRFVHAFMLVPIFISFMLTYSRAALVIVPIVILAVLPFFKLVKQLTYLLYLFVSVVLTFLILSKIESLSVSILQHVLPVADQHGVQLLSFWDTQPMQGWGILIGMSLVMALLTLVIFKWVEPWLDQKLKRVAALKSSALLAPAALIIIGVLGVTLILSSGAVRGLLPANVAERLETINFNQHSVLERATFYKNGFHIAADYPLFGAGGGAWSALYQKYQSNPYTSNQAHSYFIQTLVEVGWIGVLLHFALFAAVFFFYIRNYNRYPDKRGSHIIYYIFAVSLLAHSFIDFDMSYVSIAALLFLCLGSMLGVYKEELKVNWRETKGEAAPSKLRFIFPAAIIVLSICISIFSYRQSAAHAEYNQALALVSQNEPLSELLVPIDKAISLAPANPYYLLMKADWLSQAYQQTGDGSYLQTEKNILEKAKLLSPYERQIILLEYKYYKSTHNFDQAIDSLEEGLSKFPWDIDFYETAIQEYYDAGIRDKQNSSDQYQAKWNRALELYNVIQQQVDKLKELPAEQLQGRRFDISPAVRQIVGQIQFENHDYQSAVNTLKPALSDDLSELSNRMITRYYLAALTALGQSNDELKDKLIKADPEELQLLTSLLNI